MMVKGGMLRFWRHWWWLVVILVADVVFALWWFGPRQSRRQSQEVVVPEVSAEVEAARLARARLMQPMAIGFPTAQTGLLRREDPAVYMATASGRIESAHYGSTRTSGAAGRFRPSFHEGIDIAPLQRDRRNRALDPVLAMADGRVGYANRVVGHSNYGMYVVLEHDTGMGTVYSLYAHLRSIADDVRPGVQVQRGDTLGIMGNTPSSITPVSRSHLHFEVGVIQNRRFPSWTAQAEIRNLHGVHHGWNLTGIQPLALYGSADPVQEFSMPAYLASVPVAFELVVEAVRPVDYFQRYPSLWHGDGPARGVLVLSVCEGGVVLGGRPASAAEIAGGPRPYVLRAAADVLGRNGLRLVVERDGQWQLGRNGSRWLEILLH